MSFDSRGLATLPERRPVVALVLAALACIAVGASGSVFTAAGLASWYPGLVKPELAPPNWVFGPVWTTLFALMGVAVWLVWRAAGGERAAAARRALLIFAGHFAVNLAWSPVFFGAQSIPGGLVVIVVLWVAIVATMVAFARVDRRAAVSYRTAHSADSPGRRTDAPSVVLSGAPIPFSASSWDKPRNIGTH